MEGSGVKNTVFSKAGTEISGEEYAKFGGERIGKLHMLFLLSSYAQ